MINKQKQWISHNVVRITQDRLLTLNRSSTGKLLDIGCGNGNFTKEFSDRVGIREIWGIDIDNESLSQASSNGLRCIMADLNNPLPIPPGSFNVVLCNQVLEHLHDPDCLLAEINKAMALNGQLFLTIPNICALHERIFILLGWQPTSIWPSLRATFGNPLWHKEPAYSRPSKHLNAFSPRSIKEMLNYYGFQIVEFTGGLVPPFGNKLSKFINRLNPNFAYHLIIKAIKNKEFIGKSKVTEDKINWGRTDY